MYIIVFTCHEMKSLHPGFNCATTIQREEKHNKTLLAFQADNNYSVTPQTAIPAIPRGKLLQMGRCKQLTFPEFATSRVVNNIIPAFLQVDFVHLNLRSYKAKIIK